MKKIQFTSSITGESGEMTFPDEPKWTDKDLQEFAEWVDKYWFNIFGDNVWIPSDERMKMIMGTNNVQDYQTKTTSQLRELWEIETGRRNSNETD